MKTRLSCLVALVFAMIQVRAQTYEWWVATVHWDGVSRWNRYMIFSPAFQGPNSLPVPELTNGSVDSVDAAGLTGMFHFSKEDKTQNLRFTANYNVVKNRLSFDVSWVPVEWYKMSHRLKEERHVFSHYYYDNSAQGDIIINTNVQLLNKWRKHIHLALRLGYRFPVSSGVGAARFTDAPGYYFDLSAGKPLGSGPWKLNGMVGFYAWQTNRDDFFQDDCFLFGAGVEYNKNNWRWQLNSAGYLGYLEDYSDKPIVIRSSLEKKFKRIAGVLKFQQGVHHFKYTTIETGAKYLFK